jgi:hypothetical protein
MGRTWTVWATCWLLSTRSCAASLRTFRSYRTGGHSRARLLTLDTDDGGLDLLADPPGAPPYATMRSRADRVELDEIVIAVASLDDLLAMKRAAGRPQDLVDVEALEVVRLRRLR